MNKKWCLEQSIEIVKTCSNSSQEGRLPEMVLEETYKKLKELLEDTLQ